MRNGVANLPVMLPVRPERDVLRSCMDLLRARSIFFLRINTGAFENKRGQTVKFGHPGCSDLIAFPMFYTDNRYTASVDAYVRPVFIECKSGRGKQSKSQKVFERIVKSSGMDYCVVKSAAELLEWL
jgi:hypothetical protein